MSCCSACDTGKTCESIVSNTKDWMQKAVKRPGAFTAYAKQHGQVGEDGKINLEWARKVAKDPSVSTHVRRMANLFLTFMKAH